MKARFFIFLLSAGLLSTRLCGQEVQVFSHPFTIYASAGITESQIKTVENKLQNSYRAIKKDWGWAPNNVVTVRIFADTWRYCQTTGQPWWLGGIYQDRTLYLQAPSILENRNRLATIIGHEYTHSLIAQESAGFCPRWLNEGLAIIVSEPDSNVNRPDSLIALDRLNERLENWQDRQELGSAYDSARFYVSKLVRLYGKKRVRELLANLKANNNFADAFQATFGISINEYSDQAAASQK